MASSTILLMFLVPSFAHQSVSQYNTEVLQALSSTWFQTIHGNWREW